MKERLLQPLFYLSYLALTTPLGVYVGMELGRFFLPFVQALLVFPVYVLLLTANRWKETAAAVIFWAVWLAVVVGTLSYSSPDSMAESLVNARPYQQEMFTWIETGVGKEGDITRFLPEHLLHASVFAFVTLISGGFLGLVMGAVLMNYMSYYVGTLLAFSTDFRLVLLIGWPPWAILRVIAFIFLAMSLSAWGYQKFLGIRMNHRRCRTVFIASIVLLVTDVVLKWLLAPWWQEWLKAATELLTVTGSGA